MEDKKIDERVVKFSGSACIPDDLATLGQEVKLLVKGDIFEIKSRDNQDGTMDKIFVVKLITAENA